MSAAMELGHPDRRGGRIGGSHLVTSSKRGENGEGADRNVWGFHIQRAREILMTPLIVLFVKEQVGHQVAALSENVPAVSNVQ